MAVKDCQSPWPWSGRDRGIHHGRQTETWAWAPDHLTSQVPSGPQLKQRSWRLCFIWSSRCCDHWSSEIWELGFVDARQRMVWTFGKRNPFNKCKAGRSSSTNIFWWSAKKPSNWCRGNEVLPQWQGSTTSAKWKKNYGSWISLNASWHVKNNRPCLHKPRTFYKSWGATEFCKKYNLQCNVRSTIGLTSFEGKTLLRYFCRTNSEAAPNFTEKVLASLHGFCWQEQR